MPTANDSARVAEQYATDRHLNTRIRTHRLYSVGTDLEEQVDALLSLNGSESLLDVGTGPGNFPGRLHAAGHRGRLVGADLSGGMVAAARASYGSVEFVEAGADTLPFPDASFDVSDGPAHAVPRAERSSRAQGISAGPEAGRAFPGGHQRGSLHAGTVGRGGRGGEARKRPAATGRHPGGAWPTPSQRSTARPWVRETFGDMRLHFSDDALVFPDPQPVLAYLESVQTWLNLNDAQKLSGRAALLQVLSSSFTGGAWTVSKKTAFITAER